MPFPHIAARAKGKAKQRRMMNACVQREKQEPKNSTQHRREKLWEGGSWIEATIRDKKGTRDPPDWRPFQIGPNQSQARRGGLKLQMALR
jgi:hypothetical protein